MMIADSNDNLIFLAIPPAAVADDITSTHPPHWRATKKLAADDPIDIIPIDIVSRMNQTPTHNIRAS